MKFNDIHIGNEIKKVCDIQGISQTDLANKLGCTQPSVGYIFKNPDIQISKLKEVSIALNFDFFAMLSTSSNATNVNQYGAHSLTSFNSNITNYNGCPTPPQGKDISCNDDPEVLKETIRGLLAVIASKQETIDILKLGIKNKRFK